MVTAGAPVDTTVSARASVAVGTSVGAEALQAASIDTTAAATPARTPMSQRCVVGSLTVAR